MIELNQARLCPKCGCDSKVVDTGRYDSLMKRRRECLSCGFRYNTFEIIETELGILFGGEDDD